VPILKHPVTTASQAPTQPRRRGRWLAVTIIAALAMAYACIPRDADLAGFDPDGMARRETLMWRHYYETQYVALFIDLYALARNEYGFSPLDSMRIAVAAASAAKAFQPTASRAEAEVALPELASYFRMLAGGARVTFDIDDTARTELAWWQARHEAVKADDYGAIVARVGTLVYGIDSDEMRRAGVVRARAMYYRDAHGTNMMEADWVTIEDQLRLAYGMLKHAIVAAPK
jgi:hypothetical protein